MARSFYGTVSPCCLLFNLVPTGSFSVFQIADDVRNAYAKKLPKKSQRKEIVNNLCRSGTDSLLQNKWMTANQWARHINVALPLAVAVCCSFPCRR